MKQQTGKTAAIYYRAANKQMLELHLDNQMHTLLCYANRQELDSFTLYADIGKNGLTFDRPAFNALKADIDAGRICKLIVHSISRIGRNFIPTGEFIEWAQAQGVEVVSVMDGELNAPPLGVEIALLCDSLLKGGDSA